MHFVPPLPSPVAGGKYTRPLLLRMLRQFRSSWSQTWPLTSGLCPPSPRTALFSLSLCGTLCGWGSLGTPRDIPTPIHMLFHLNTKKLEMGFKEHWQPSLVEAGMHLFPSPCVLAASWSPANTCGYNTQGAGTIVYKRPERPSGLLKVTQPLSQFLLEAQPAWRSSKCPG